MAYYPEVIYTIISLAGENQEMKAFKIKEENYREVEILVKDQD